MFKKLTAVSVMLAGVVGLGSTAPAHAHSISEADNIETAIAYVNRMKEDLGYFGVKVIGFEDGDGRAITSLYHTAQDPDYLRLAIPTNPGDKPMIQFQTDRDCSITPPDRVKNFVIKVSEQRIRATYVCGARTGGGTRETFIMETEAGKDYVVQEFLDHPYVFVELTYGAEFFFSTEGIRPILRELNEPAL